MVIGFFAQLIVVPLTDGLLYPAEQVPLYVHLFPLVLTLHVAAPVPLAHVLHVDTVHKLLTLLLLHVGAAHVAKFAIAVQVTEHAVFAVALYLVPVPLVVRPPGHAVHFVDALLFSLYEPVAHATWSFAPPDATKYPSLALVHAFAAVPVLFGWYVPAPQADHTAYNVVLDVNVPDVV